MDKIRKKLPLCGYCVWNPQYFPVGGAVCDKHGEPDSMMVDIWEGYRTRSWKICPQSGNTAFKSGVNIMFGCNNFCSYCIVPYVRGRERSREPEDIINEIEKSGSRWCRLRSCCLGQNVNSYGKTSGAADDLCAASARGGRRLTGLQRIRFMTSHPKDLSDELIRGYGKESKKICRHLHLPLQSGSSRILKLMNRRYD